MKHSQFNVYKLLLENKNVNYYTKMILVLSSLNYYCDYYIPNSKLMKLLNINKKNCIRLLHQLEEDNIIYLHYVGRKRYFGFKISEEKKEESVKQEMFDYNWLDEE